MEKSILQYAKSNFSQHKTFVQTCPFNIVFEAENTLQLFLEKLKSYFIILLLLRIVTNISILHTFI